jgi:hypothetical protein
MRRLIIKSVLAAMVGLISLALLSGCERSAQVQTPQALAVVGIKQPAAVSPIELEQQEPTPEEEAKFQAENDAIYKKLDAQVIAAHAAHATKWQPTVEVQRALEAAAPNAKIQRTGCTKDFCRYVVAVKDVQALQTFSSQFSVEGLILFNFATDASLSVTAYVFRPGVDLSNV